MEKQEKIGNRDKRQQLQQPVALKLEISCNFEQKED